MLRQLVKKPTKTDNCDKKEKPTIYFSEIDEI